MTVAAWCSSIAQKSLRRVSQNTSINSPDAYEAKYALYRNSSLGLQGKICMLLLLIQRVAMRVSRCIKQQCHMTQGESGSIRQRSAAGSGDQASLLTPSTMDCIQMHVFERYVPCKAGNKATGAPNTAHGTKVSEYRAYGNFWWGQSRQK